MADNQLVSAESIQLVVTGAMGALLATWVGKLLYNLGGKAKLVWHCETQSQMLKDKLKKPIAICTTKILIENTGRASAKKVVVSILGNPEDFRVRRDKLLLAGATRVSVYHDTGFEVVQEGSDIHLTIDDLEAKSRATVYFGSQSYHGPHINSVKYDGMVADEEATGLLLFRFQRAFFLLYLVRFLVLPITVAVAAYIVLAALFALEKGTSIFP